VNHRFALTTVGSAKLHRRVGAPLQFHAETAHAAAVAAAAAAAAGVARWYVVAAIAESLPGPVANAPIEAR